MLLRRSLILTMLTLLAAVGTACAQAEPTSTPARTPTAASSPTPFPTGTAALAPPLRFLALGDSYTIGESVEVSQRWPVQLVRRLREEGTGISEPQIVARTGWTTSELSSAIDRADIRPPYDLVTLLIGVNNQFRGLDVGVYRAELVALLDRAVEFAGGEPSKVIVLSIPDWGVTPFAASVDRAQIAAEIDRFNAVNREEAVRTGARYVDITPISREAETDPELVAADGLHPSGKMYQVWTELVLAEVQALPKES